MTPTRVAVPIPLSATPYVRRYANPVLIHLAGHGWFADLEHVGRRTGLVRHTPLLELGPPRVLGTEQGIARMPQPIRFVLGRTGFCRDFVELPVVGERRAA